MDLGDLENLLSTEEEMVRQAANATFGSVQDPQVTHPTQLGPRFWIEIMLARRWAHGVVAELPSEGGKLKKAKFEFLQEPL